jgi:hypothetical protein
MTRALAVVAVACGLTLGASAQAQVDFAKLAAGLQGCPELAADAGLGSLAAFFCEPVDRTSLDLPISGYASLPIRAGSFSLLQRYLLLAVAQGSIPDGEFATLRAQLFANQVLTIPQAAQSRALLAEAGQAEAAGDDALAAQLRQQAEAIIAGTFDASIPDLLLARIDRDRLADLRAGRFTQIGGVDTVPSYAGGLATDILGSLGGVPPTLGVQGEFLNKGGVPFFVGPDGLANTADDLPFVLTNPVALAAGYVLGAPIAGTPEDRFDRVQGSGSSAIAVYTATAQRTVPSLADPSVNKLVEVYGIYNPKFLALNGCVTGLHGTFNRTTGICTDSVGNDITAAALAAGCPVIAVGSANTLSGIGVNADGDCIELNTGTGSSSPGARVQVEVLPLLGDAAIRPAQAPLEPADLTDLKARSMLLPARPASSNGTVLFPIPVGGARRGVDLSTGAPLDASGSSCGMRVGGPNGVSGDGDDVFPSAGACLLWSAPDPNGVQHLSPGSVVGASHTANQSLFHTLCSASFDADSGHCSLDGLNDPDALDFISSLLGGLGGLGGLALAGTEKIRTPDNPLESIELRNPGIKEFQFMAVNPQGPQDNFAQDLGLNLPRGSAALLGCGEAFANPCSKKQAQVWAMDPAIAASIGRHQNGGIDLLNTDAGVLIQEFAAEKVRHANALVGVAASGDAYLPGVNFSRDGTFTMVPNPETGFSEPIETGSFLPLTPGQVLAMTPAERASYQHGGASKVQADGWVEAMPWATDPDALAKWGAIVFQSDPNDPIAGPLNVFNPLGGEYCGRWMITSTLDSPVTPFNETCTALETASANYERLIVAQSIIGQDRVFDPPESLAELVAMLDDDPSNDATGDPISGPDGIFSNNQFVFNDDEMDFQVTQKRNPQVPGQVIVAPANKAQALTELRNFDPNVSCTEQATCYYDVTATLQNTTSAYPLVLALPIGYTVDRIVLAEPNDPNVPQPPVQVIGQTKLNLARLEDVDRHSLLMLFAGQPVSVNGELVQMNQLQHLWLFADSNPNPPVYDLNQDGVNDLDEDRDGVWDGADDYTGRGPTSDDEVACGSGIRGDTLLESGIQYEPYRRDEAPGSAAFQAAFPNGLPPRSPLFCRSLNRLLSLVESAPDGTRRFVWHSATGALGDGDADGWADALDNCPTVANAGQEDGDGDGVGDVCDNCVTIANPRVPADYLALNDWATLTGRQRDDDHDGYGNRCDAKFPGVRGNVVGPGDLVELRASIAKDRGTDTCGVSGTRACALFDLEETGNMIGSGDVMQFRLLNGKAPGPKCPTCPLVCTAGTAGTCGPVP